MKLLCGSALAAALLAAAPALAADIPDACTSYKAACRSGISA